MDAKASHPSTSGRRRSVPAPRTAPGLVAAGQSLLTLPQRSSVQRVHVFDFDATLIHTPLPDEGAAAWLAATGTPWPHSGWWGRPESLAACLPTHEGPALSEWRAASADASCVCVLLTGRRAHLLGAVSRVLLRHGVHGFHAVHLNDTGHDTLQYKLGVLTQLSERYRGTAEIHIWEDRAPHATEFEALGRRLAMSAWVVHLVPARAPSLPPPSAAALSPSPLSPPPPRAAAPGDRLSAASGSPQVTSPRPRGDANGEPFMEVRRTARLCVALPWLAACVPPEWCVPLISPRLLALHTTMFLNSPPPPPRRAAKSARDGASPPAHVTLLNAAELSRLLGEASAAGGSDARDKLVATLRRVRHGPLRTLGLGCAVGGASGAAACAYVAVSWPPGAACRAALSLPPADFHITLGFDGEDPHGVDKGARTLLRAPQGGWSRDEGEGARQRMAALQARVEALRSAARRGAGGSARRSV